MDRQMGQATTIGIIAKPVTVKVAQTVGITATAFLAGQTAALTYGLLPSIMDSPARPLAQQWRKAQDTSSSMTVVLSAVGTGVFAWMASREPSVATSSFRLYTLAAMLTPAGILFNTTVMGAVNRELQERDDRFNSTHAGFASGISDAEAAAIPQPRSSLREFVANATSREQPEDMTVHQLVDTWGWLNLAKALLLGVSAACGAYAVVDEDLSFFE